MKKRALVFLLLLIMVFSVFAAGSAEKKQESNVTLRLWSPPVFATQYMDQLKRVISDYEAKNPNVKIELEELNWDGIGEKLETAMMTGSTPDIYIDGTARTAKLPTTGLCVSVDDVLANLSGMNEGAVSIGENGGSHYLVPMTLMPPTTIVINATLAKKYGVYDMLPADRISWDWDTFVAFLSACGEKSLKEGIYPVGFHAGSQSSDIAYYTMLMSAGTYVLNEDHTACTVNTPAAEYVFGKIKDLSANGLIYPGAAEMTDDDVDALYYSGKIVCDVAATPGALYILPIMNEMKAEGIVSEIPETETYAWPTLNGSTTVSGTWGANCIAIFENEKDASKIAAAKDFVAYLMSDKSFSETIWAAAPGYAPARDLGQQLVISDPQMIREAEVNGIISNNYNTSSFGLLESYWGEIRQYFYPELQSVILGNKTPKQALDSFEKNVNQVLANNSK